MHETTLLELLKHGVHFGHQTSKWHPNMRPYIFTAKNGIHIINLEQSLEHLQRAQAFARGIAAKGGTVLFVGTKRQAKEIVRTHAQSCGMPYITERWLGGLCTNFGTVSNVIKRLNQLTDDREKGALGKYTKKERFRFDDEIEKLEKLVGGVRTLSKLPDAIFVVDLKVEKTAVREAQKVRIPLIAIADTNTDPTDATYPIPANDDATKSLDLITSCIADAVRDGREEHAAAKEAAIVAAAAAAAEKAAAPEAASA